MSGQPQWLSITEAVVNTVGGFGVALAAQVWWVFPQNDIHISITTSAKVAFWMLLISLVRQYAFRRGFNWFEQWRCRVNYDNVTFPTLSSNAGSVYVDGKIYVNEGGEWRLDE